MIRHYLKIAFRNLFKHKGISLINIFGLAVGMVCTVLIFLWVSQQLSYDQWVEKKERIYRLEAEDWVLMQPFLRETTLAFPEVENAARMFFWWEPRVKYQDKIFRVEKLALSDSCIFNIFNFDFIAGEKATAFAAPFSIVLTESMAKKIFDDENAMGKMIKVSDEYDYRVTGIVRDIEKFHLKINAFIDMNDVVLMNGNDDFLTSRSHNHDIYVLTKPNVNINHLVEKINDRAVEVDRYEGARLFLRPFNDIYFTQNLMHEPNTKHGSISLIIVFSLVALMILAIACINFINLTIARTSTREKEIAVRKVTGANQKLIQFQFFGETFIIVFISFIITLILVSLLLPWFSNLTTENITLSSLSGEFFLIMLSVLVFTGFISGIYPSFYLSVLQPVMILKGKSSKGKNNSILSRVLIAFQFIISVFLIISILTVMKQLNFMLNKDLGFDNDQLLTFRVSGDRFSGEHEKRIAARQVFAERLKANTNIKGVTFINQLPGQLTNTWTFYKHDPKQKHEFRVFWTDPNFLDIMGIELVEGKNYSFDRSSELDNGFIINEEAVRQLDLQDMEIKSMNGGKVPVHGIVKDFHFNSLHNKIIPLGIRWGSHMTRTLIKVSEANVGETIKHIENIYNEFCPDSPFEYNFLDETFAAEYKSEQQLEAIISYFVSIAIILSCLGLFALTALTAQQKIKEIGIRKVLGSTNTGIVKLISRSFLQWILISNLIAWPAAYFILQSWLETFAYRIDQTLAIYVASAFLSMLVALITISTQAYKAATANPVDSLRNE